MVSSLLHFETRHWNVYLPGLLGKRTVAECNPTNPKSLATSSHASGGIPTMTVLRDTL